jgi:PEP-CTERM motif-containing protein
MTRKALFFMLVLLSSAGNAQPTFPTDADWTAVTKGGVAITDASLDVLGTGRSFIDFVSASAPSAFYSTDGTYLFFRLRVDGDPTDSSGFLSAGWGVQISTDGIGTTWEYAAILNGSSERVEVWQSPIPQTSPGANLAVLVNVYNAGLYGRDVSAGGTDFFVDFAVPLADLGSPGTAQFVFGTNSNGLSAFTTGSSGDIAGIGVVSNPTWGSIASDTVALTTPIPEPETYALLLAGLGLIGFAARRRKGLFQQ